MFKKIAVSAAAMLASASSFAAIPTNVNTALTDGLTDATGVAALGLVIVVGIAVFKYMRRGV